MWQKRNKKSVFFFKGSVAVFALLLMFILAAATVGIISTATIERKVSISTGNSTTAFQLAESGMEKTLQFFKSHFDQKLSDVGSCAVGTGIVTYDSSNTIRFKDAGDSSTIPPTLPAYITNCSAPISSVKIIKSIGTTKQETRAIEEDVFLGATKLLLHLNGKSEVAPYRFEDSSYYSNHPITTNGTVSAETLANPSFSSNKSANFDGATGYLSVPDSTDWSFGTGNFTIDFWINFNSLGNVGEQQNIVSQYQDALNWWFIYKAENSGTKPNKFGLGTIGGTGSGFQMSSGWSDASIGTWHHIAFVRKGETGYIFIDGKTQTLSNSTIGNLPDISGPLLIGKWSGGFPNYFVNGYMDEVRISKGVARWTSDFTPPTKEYWPD